MTAEWPADPDRAEQVQRDLARRLVLTWDGRPVRTVAGADAAFDGDTVRAAVVVLAFPGLEPVAAAVAEIRNAFPYVPGLLGFREGPAIVAAWARLESKPDLVLFDAHGIAHPRGCGEASQLALLFNVPGIGVAKTRLRGVHDEPGPERGAVAWLRDENDRTWILGAAVRTRDRVRPVFVSPGHLIDPAHAVEFTLACAPRFRIPEPLRCADALSRRGFDPRR